MSLKWEGKKCHLGLPLSFTRYRIEDGMVVERKGILSINEEQTQLHRIIDIAFKQNILDLFFKQGTLLLSAKNASDNIVLKNVKYPNEVKRILNKEIDNERQRQKVYSREDIDREDEQDYD